MRKYRVFAISLAILHFCLPPAVAQTTMSPDQGLRSAIAALPPGSEVVLTPGQYAQPLEVFEGSVRVTATGAVFSDPQANSVIYVEGGATLDLTGVEIIGSRPEQATIVVNGGTLVLNDAKISGTYRFAIYATQGSVIEINNLQADGGELGIYLLDQVSATIDGAQLSGFAGAGLTGIGAQVDVLAQSVTVQGSQGSAVVLRDQAQLRLEDASILSAAENGVYLDQGASFTGQSVVLDQMATGILALGAGDVSVRESEISGFTNGGIVVETATSLTVDWVQMFGRGNVIAATGAVPTLSITQTVADSDETEVAALYIGHQGALVIKDTSASGGSSALFLNGPRTGATVIETSDFVSSGFSAVTLKGVQSADRQNAPVLRGNNLMGTGGAVGLAFDTTDFAQVTDNQIAAETQPALSFYESAEAQFDGNILITGHPQLQLGDIRSNLFADSAANVSRTEVTPENLNDAYQQLAEDRTAKQEAAKNLGQVVAVNAKGLPLWADAAIMQVLSQDDQLFDLPIDGTALELPSGQYWYALDGIAQGQFDLAPGARVEVEIPDPVHPHFLFVKNGEFYRGKALMLRAPEELAANARARNVNHMWSEYYNQPHFARPKADLTAEEKAAILTEARALLTDHIATAVQVGVSREAVEGGAISRQVFVYLLGIMAHMGDLSDRDFLLAHLGDQRSFITNYGLAAAALIEARFGQIDSSAIYAMAMDPETAKPLAFQMLTYTGLNGHAPSIEELLQRLMAAYQTGARADIADGARAYMLLNQLENDPRVLKIYRSIVAEYRAQIDNVVVDKQPRDYHTSMGFNYYNLPMVVEYLAAFGTEADYASVNLPMGGFFAVEPSFATLVTNPLALYYDHIGQAPRPEPFLYDPYTLSLAGVYLCQALERRHPDDRAFLLDQAYALTGRYVNHHFGTNDLDHDWVFGERYVNIPSSYCNPNTAPGDAWSSDRDGLRIYFTDLYSPNWGERQATARQLINDFDPATRESVVRYLAGMTADQFLEATKDDPKFDNDAGRALQLQSRALEHRYRDFAPDIYTNGSDSRFFVTGLDASNGDAIVVGRVDMRPILADGLLRTGLRLRMAYSENGFLTAQMSGRDVEMAAALENAAFGMIKEVRLREGDTVRPLAFNQTTGSGAHVFDLPDVSDDLAGKVIEVELHVFKETWVLQFPLYYGDFAFRYRSGL